MNHLSCALTGHRELPADFDKNALYDVLETLIEEGYRTFYCGMAQGFDLTALACLVDLKRKYRLFLEACIPFEGQQRHYPPQDKGDYDYLLQWCDRKTVLFDRYCDGCFLARDRYMVDRADVVLAYCTKDTGGTAYTVRYARRKGVPVRNV